MWIENHVYKEDLDNLLFNSCVPWDYFKDSRFFITGGTGLIGSTLINALVYANLKLDLNIDIKALVRDIKKAKALFDAQVNACKNLEFIQGCIENLPDIGTDYDYIIHAASPTASKFFSMNPVETIKISVGGTQNLLDVARIMHLKGFVYLSSMEVYGSPTDGQKISEDSPLWIDLSLPRSSYPISKCLCESLCASYNSEYGVPTKALRLAQTFGPGMDYHDSRLIGQLIRSSIEKKDIVLNTTGESKRCYLYAFDAISAILISLCNNDGNYSVYNVANDSTFCSIYELSKLVSRISTNGEMKVIIKPSGNGKSIYPSTSFLDLDISGMKRNGWFPVYGLVDMLNRTIAAYSHLEDSFD